MSGASPPLSNEANVRAMLGLSEEAALRLVDACSRRPRVGAFSQPDFFWLFLFLRRLIRFFQASNSVPCRMHSDLASGEEGGWVLSQEGPLLQRVQKRGRLEGGQDLRAVVAAAGKTIPAPVHSGFLCPGAPGREAFWVPLHRPRA